MEQASSLAASNKSRKFSAFYGTKRFILVFTRALPLVHPR